MRKKVALKIGKYVKITNFIFLFIEYGRGIQELLVFSLPLERKYDKFDNCSSMY